MTVQTRPGGVRLDPLPGQPDIGPADNISDSSWDGLPEEPDNTQANLGRIARARKGSKEEA